MSEEQPWGPTTNGAWIAWGKDMPPIGSWVRDREWEVFRVIAAIMPEGTTIQGADGRIFCATSALDVWVEDQSLAYRPPDLLPDCVLEGEKR